MPLNFCYDKTCLSQKKNLLQTKMIKSKIMYIHELSTGRNKNCKSSLPEVY